MQIIELREYESKLYPRQEISPSAIAFLRNKYSSQLKITIQDSKNGDCWHIKAQGWVGYIPVNSKLAIRIIPKIPIENLLGMLEYAYNLRAFQFLDNLTECKTLTDFYNRLVKLLCELILQRCHQGLYKTYIDRTSQLTYVRGRIDIRQTIREPWKAKVTCHYHEQTTDIKENQILLWTLHLISCHQLCNELNKSLVRKIYHKLHNIVSLKYFTIIDLDDLKYNRLNEDYQKIHSLCRFFIGNIMPSHNIGDYLMLPFIVNMAQLYEQFVAQWLKINLPKSFELKIQKKVNLITCSFKIDLVICETSTKKNIYVLDTKYKNSERSTNNDIYQINSYATSQHCNQARLIYPQKLRYPLKEKIGNIQIESLVFSLQNNLEQSGKYFLQTLFNN